MRTDVLVPVFVVDQRPVRGSLEALGEAARLAPQLCGRAVAVLVGERPSPELVEALNRHGAEAILYGGGDQTLSGHWLALLDAVIERTDASLLLAGAGRIALEIAGQLAARHGGGVVSDVTAVRIEDGTVTVERPIFNDTLIGRAQLRHGLCAIVSRAGAFAIERTLPSAAEPQELAPVGARSEGIRVRDRGNEEDPGGYLATADVIVAGGRGFGSAEAFAQIEPLARAFGAGTAVAATRAVTDAEWWPQQAQIGATGRTVSPTLYLAIGISGAPQHQDGMQTSQHVIAVNSDARAPIFKIADLGVITDLHALVPELTAALQSRRASV